MGRIRWASVLRTYHQNSQNNIEIHNLRFNSRRIQWFSYETNFRTVSFSCCVEQHHRIWSALQLQLKRSAAKQVQETQIKLPQNISLKGATCGIVLTTRCGVWLCVYRENKMATYTPVQNSYEKKTKPNPRQTKGTLKSMQVIVGIPIMRTKSHFCWTALYRRIST